MEKRNVNIVFNEDNTDASYYCYPDSDFKIEIKTTGYNEFAPIAMEKAKGMADLISTACNSHYKLIEIVKELISAGTECLDYSDGSGRPILQESIWKGQSVISAIEKLTNQ